MPVSGDVTEFPVHPGSWATLNQYLRVSHNDDGTTPGTPDSASIYELSASSYVPQTLSASGTEQYVWTSPVDCVLTGANLVAMGGAVAASDSTFWTVGVNRFRGVETYYNYVNSSLASSYWPFDEPSGTLATDVIAAANGTSTAGVTVNQTPVTGYRASYLFNGTTGWVEVPSSSALDLGDGPFTLECWFKRGATGVQQILIHRGTNAYTIFIDAGDHLAFSQAGVGTICSSGSVTVADANSHHGVVTKNGSDVHLYLDGVDVTTSLVNRTLVNNASIMRIGASTTGGTPMTGNIDNVALYKRVLTANEVATHYASGQNPGVVATKTTKVTNGEAIIQRGDWNFDAVAFDPALKILAKGDVIYFTFTRTSTPANLINTGCAVRYQPV